MQLNPPREYVPPSERLDDEARARWQRFCEIGALVAEWEDEWGPVPGIETSTYFKPDQTTSAETRAEAEAEAEASTESET